MKITNIPINNPREFAESLNVNVVGDNNLESTPATQKDIDKIYHIIQLQALRVDELENRIRALEQEN